MEKHAVEVQNISIYHRAHREHRENLKLREEKFEFSEYQQKKIKMNNPNINHITEKIIGAAIEVHRTLGPGLLESAYEACLVYELNERGLKVEAQKPVPLVYKSVSLDCGYRLDVLVEDLVVVEIKSVDKLMPIHRAQVISYLRLARLPLGLLINFNVKLLKLGIERIAGESLNQS